MGTSLSVAPFYYHYLILILSFLSLSLTHSLTHTFSLYLPSIINYVVFLIISCLFHAYPLLASPPLPPKKCTPMAGVLSVYEGLAPTHIASMTIPSSASQDTEAPPRLLHQQNVATVCAPIHKEQCSRNTCLFAPACAQQACLAWQEWELLGSLGHPTPLDVQGGQLYTFTLMIDSGSIQPVVGLASSSVPPGDGRSSSFSTPPSSIAPAPSSLFSIGAGRGHGSFVGLCFRTLMAPPNPPRDPSSFPSTSSALSTSVNTAQDTEIERRTLNDPRDGHMLWSGHAGLSQCTRE